MDPKTVARVSTHDFVACHVNMQRARMSRHYIIDCQKNCKNSSGALTLILVVILLISFEVEMKPFRNGQRLERLLAISGHEN